MNTDKLDPWFNSLAGGDALIAFLVVLALTAAIGLVIGLVRLYHDRYRVER